MANALITPTWVLKRVGRIAINNLKFANNVDRSYDDDYVQAGAKVGDTISLRLPQRFITTKGQAFQQQAIVDKIVPVTLTDQANVGISFSSFQMTVDVDDYNSRYVEPAAVQLANTMDFDGLSRCQNLIYNAVGTPGSNPTANSTYLQAFALLSNLAAPPRRQVITSVDMQTAITAANFALFNPTSTIAESFREGVYATNTLGFREWYWDQNVAVHTNGTWTVVGIVNGANQTGSSLITDTWTTASLNTGDKFTIAGVHSVNPQNYQSTGSLQEFRVTSPVSDTGGAITIPIDPPIITSGALQTVDISPADNAVITMFGTTGQQYHAAIAWAKEAIVMVMADLVEPQGGALSERIRSKPLGFALRFVKQYNILSDQNLARIDAIYGWQVYRPEWTCIIAGA